MSTKNSTKGLPPITYIFIVIITFFLITTIFPLVKSLVFGNVYPSSENMSIGNRLLVIGNTNDDKEKGIKSFKKGDYAQAEKHFQASLQLNPNDPETLIYLWNSQAIQSPIYLKIAAVVPIGSNENVAQEILRGIASAQEGFNQQGGFNGNKLLVQIVDDKNDPDISIEVASKLIKDDKILAVIGSNASNASLAAAPIYQQANLVMITPTSFSDSLSGLAWRLVPSTKISGAVLADYVINTAKKSKIAICYDSSASDTVSFKDEFISALFTKKATILPLVCDVSKGNFNPEAMMTEILNQGADGLFLVSHIDKIPERVIPIATVNAGRLPLFSSGSLYNIETLKHGEVLKGLTLVAPYHSQLNPDFAQKMERQWNGRVSWRSATSFDATNVIIKAMSDNQTRDGIKTSLQNPSFSIKGATGVVKFDPNTGDRLGDSLIVRVKKISPNNYDFVL